MMDKFQDQFYKEYGTHSPETIDVCDCFVLNPNGELKISKIKGFYNQFILGLEIFYDKKSFGPKVGKVTNEGMNKVEVNLYQFEEIIEISGSATKFINYICFKTSEGRKIHIGNAGSQGTTFFFNMGGMVIRQIKYGIGDYLNYIGARFFNDNYFERSSYPHSRVSKSLSNSFFRGDPNYNIPITYPTSSLSNSMYGSNSIVNELDRKIIELYKKTYKEMDEFQSQLQTLLLHKNMYTGKFSESMTSSQINAFPYDNPLMMAIPNINNMPFLQGLSMHQKSSIFGAKSSGNSRKFNDYTAFILNELKQFRTVEITQVILRGTETYVCGLEINYRILDAKGIELYQRRVIHKGYFKHIFIKHKELNLTNETFINEIDGEFLGEINFLRLTAGNNSNLNLIQAIGQYQGGHKFTCKIPPGKKIVAFGGAVDFGLVNFYVYY